MGTTWTFPRLLVFEGGRVESAVPSVHGRNPTPRHPRLVIPGATYHVYCPVARGEFVFDDEFEALEFVETLREVRDHDRWTVCAWCLMRNHHHLVLKIEQSRRLNHLDEAISRQA